MYNKFISNKGKRSKNMMMEMLGAAILILQSSFFISCENGDAEFPDYEKGTTAYFAYQYPIRTIVLGDDEYDTTGDKAGKFRILSTFGGSYNGSEGSVTVAVDPTLCTNLKFEDGTPVKPMPTNYYTLQTTTFNYNGSMNGGTEVQLSDAFFNDDKAAQTTYVIPLVIVGQTGFDRIATGTLKEGMTGSRTDASVWEVLPMDYVLYCVKFQNKYSGFWLTNGTTSTANIEKAANVEIKCRSLKESVYTVTFQGEWIKYKRDDSGNIMTDAAGNMLTEKESRMFTADMLLSFSGDRTSTNDNCTISSLTTGVTVTGSGSWTDNGEKKSWGNKDRDLMSLNYSLDFGKDELGNDIKFAKNEKLVWFRSGVTLKEFAPIYN